MSYTGVITQIRQVCLLERGTEDTEALIYKTTVSAAATNVEEG